MVGKTNVGGGGKLFAVIAVTYPEGSVCTCTNGTKTLKARDTSGKALFNVPLGEWTVSCTDGAETASKTVSITTEGQSESITLSYLTYYYDKGDTFDSITGGWVKVGTGGSLTFNAESMTLIANNYQQATHAATVNMVSLADIKTLYFSVKSKTSYPTGRPRIGVATINNPAPADESKWAATSTLSVSDDFQTVSVDVSNCTGSYYILIAGFNGDSGYATIEVKAIWGDDK